MNNRLFEPVIAIMKQQTIWFSVACLFAMAAGSIAFDLGGRQATAQNRLQSVSENRVSVGTQQRTTVGGLEANSGIRTENAEIAGLKVALWYPASYGTAPVPLVIFSHGLHGSNMQSTFLMKALAGAGYLVVAPNHKDAGFGRSMSKKPEANFVKPETWSDSTYRDRANDIIVLLRALKQDPARTKAIDWSKVALAGHSLGGYTVLGLAGAWPTWKLPEVKAVLALSPYALPFEVKGSLGAIKVPVMYQGGTRDIGITPWIGQKSGAYYQTPGPAYFVDLDKAGHFAWTDLNPRYQASINYYCTAFLDRYVRGNLNAHPEVRRQDVSELLSK